MAFDNIIKLSVGLIAAMLLIVVVAFPIIVEASGTPSVTYTNDVGPRYSEPDGAAHTLVINSPSDITLDGEAVAGSTGSMVFGPGGNVSITSTKWSAYYGYNGGSSISGTPFPVTIQINTNNSATIIYGDNKQISISEISYYYNPSGDLVRATTPYIDTNNDIICYIAGTLSWEGNASYASFISFSDNIEMIWSKVGGTVPQSTTPTNYTIAKTDVGGDVVILESLTVDFTMVNSGTEYTDDLTVTSFFVPVSVEIPGERPSYAFLLDILPVIIIVGVLSMVAAAFISNRRA